MALSRITGIPNACDLELFHPRIREVKQPKLIKDLLPPLLQGSCLQLSLAPMVLLTDDAVLMRLSSSVGSCDIQLLFIGDGSCKPALERRVASEGLETAIFCLDTEAPTCADPAPIRACWPDGA